MASSARCRPRVVPSPALLLVLTLLACATAGESTVCDGANCGKGHCAEVPGLIPSYKCECDPGWSQLLNLTGLPCAIPNCTLDKACFNLTLEPPRGLPITDVCVAVNCGPGGTCKKQGNDFLSFACECQPGYSNVLNLTALPCVKSCKFGADCKAMGLAPPPESPLPSPAPPGNHGSPGAPAAPGSASSHKGSVPSRTTMQLLLLLLAAMFLVL